MADTFDAVLAEVRANSTLLSTQLVVNRLADAHAAEVAERDARIERLFAANEQVMARAEAAERDATRYRWLRENCGYSGSGLHTGAQVIVYYADMGNGKHRIAYTGPEQRVDIMAIDAAIDAAIATTEQDHD